jgi:LacI family gluconate utilization system Gnt-I transcriptional repressor
METVGRMAGVSQVTVSRALSEPAKVSAETLRRIHEAIRVTGFVPNALAGALASQRSMLVSALVPSISNIVYASMIASFNERMRARGYQILLSETGFDPGDEEAFIATHLSRRPDAVLLTGIHHSARSRRMLLAAGVPVVEVWDISTTPIDICVGFSHVEAARAAADFAAGAGYRRAACVSAGDERARRRQQAFSEHFERSSGHAVLEAAFDAPATLANGRAGLSRLLQGGFSEGVVFCSSDLLAHGVMIEAHARGLAVPHDVAVIGFGDQDYAAAVEPALTTVRVDREALGAAAAETILSRFRGEEHMENVIDIGFEIIRRGSA